MNKQTAIDPAMQACIKNCEDCHRMCLTTAILPGNGWRAR